MIPHLPLLRGGRPYRSLATAALRDVRGGAPVAEASQANPGLVARDLAGAAGAARALAELPAAELIAVCRRAGALFAEADLPLDEERGEAQSPEAYLRQLAATTGLPHAAGRRNVEKLRWVLEHMDEVLAGLAQGLDLGALDAPAADGGAAHPRGGWLRLTDVLGAVLPGNSPGVHTLWLPALALKVPVALKPGREEPWTPYRLLRALAAAGCPREALGFYPTDHAGAAAILLRCGRSLLFGDGATVAPWAGDERVALHGPGRSKLVLDEEQAAAWEGHLELIAASVVEGGGRSCLNASGVWLGRTARRPGAARAAAEALAERLLEVAPRPLDDPDAVLAASPPERARQLSGWLDRQLAIPGAEDLTAARRGGARLAELDGWTFLLPTVVWCADPEHPLARTELPFPFVTVVEAPQAEIPRHLGPTLVATALTADARFRRELLACRTIDRLNLGPIPTTRVAWDEPHEGNLFEHLYRRRAVGWAPLSAA